MRTDEAQWSGIWRGLGLLLCLGAVVGLAQAPSLDGALTALRQAGADVEKQATAVRDLAALGAAAEEALIKDLADSDRQVRLNAALALGRLRAARAVEPLLARCGEDADPEVRGAAAEALGRLGDERAVAPLLGLLAGAEAHELDHRSAAVALGCLRATVAVEALLRMLESTNWEVRWRAAVALGQISDPRSRTALGRLAGDENAVVAACAVWAGSALINAADLRALERNLRGTDDAVTWGSAWALGIIGTTSAIETLLDAFKSGSPSAQAASRTVLAWLGMPMAATPAALPPTALPPVAPALGSAGTMLLDERWTDRYGKLGIEITRPVVLSSSTVRPELGAQARPCLYPLPNGDLLLLVEPHPESEAAPREALRSRDKGLTWQPEPTLVQRVAAVAALRNRTVLVYDQYLFQKEGQQYVTDLCISRDGGRSFGPLQLAEFTLPAEQMGGRQSAEVIAAYKASAARWSERACTSLSPRLAELGDDSLVACGLTHADAGGSAGAVCYRSTDRGLTWARAASLARDEVSGLALASGGGSRLVALLALGTGPTLHTALSADDGRTWSEPQSARVRGATVDLCRLPGGVLACCYGGPGVSLMFSIDGSGKAWTDKIRVAEASDGVTGWASLCAAGPDRLLLVYDQRGALNELAAAPTTVIYGAYITLVGL